MVVLGLDTRAMTAGAVQAQGTMAKLSATAKQGLGGVVPLAALAAGAAVLKFGADSVRAYSEAQTIAAQTNAVIASTGGAANVSVAGVGALADELADLAGADDEAIVASQNLLLTFRDIRDEAGAANTFERTERAILDMATAMNSGAIPTLEDLRATTIQVGKAVNDPIRGFTALQRVGVTFTASQRAAVEAMIEANDLMGAQDVILSELEKEFGGAAKAAGDTFAGELGDLSREFGNLQEKIGAGLVPVMRVLVDVAGVLIDNIALVGTTLLGLTALKLLPPLLFQIALGLEAVGAAKIATGILNVAASLSGLAGVLASGPVLLGAAAIGVGALYDRLNKGAQDYARELGNLRISTTSTGESTIETAEGFEVLHVRFAEAEKTLRSLGASSQRYTAMAADMSPVQRAVADAVGETNAELRLQAQRHLEAAAAALEQRSAELSLAGGLVGVAADFTRLNEAQAELENLRRQGIASGPRFAEVQTEILNSGLALTGSLQELAAGMLEEGETTDSTRRKLIALGEQYGLSAGDIRRLLPNIQSLIDRYGDVPERVVTRITLDGIDLAMAQIASLDARLQEITEKQWRANLNLTTSGGSTAFDLIDHLEAELVEIGQEDFVVDLRLRVVDDLGLGSVQRILERLGELRGQIGEMVGEGLSRSFLREAKELEAAGDDLISNLERKGERLQRIFDNLQERAREFGESVRSAFDVDLAAGLAGLDELTQETAAQFLTEQLAQATGFANALTQLQEAGLGGAGLEQLIGVGPGKGLEVAQLLLASPELLAQFNQTQDALAELGKTTEQTLVDEVFGPSLEKAADHITRFSDRAAERIDRFTGRLEDFIDSFDRNNLPKKFDNLAESLGRFLELLSGGGGGTGGTGPSAAAGASFVGGGTVVNVTVQGSVLGDVDRIAEAVDGALKRSRNRSGALALDA